MNNEPRIPVDRDKIKSFCEKWKIIEYSFFGSVLTDNFRDDSDVNVLVEFADDAQWGLFDMEDMESELRTLFGRSVDLLTRRSIVRSENYLMRRSVLSSARTFYAA